MSIEIPGWRHVYSGKVRDLYEPETGGEEVLVVASDRISAFDAILPTPIPDKGKVLTALSMWWFDQLEPLVTNHVITTEVPGVVAGRAMICHRLDMVEVECVARGYLTGSGLSEYRESGTVCEVPLPAGLDEGSRLSEPIFTPALKAAVGDHDENVSFDRVMAEVGPGTAARLRALTLEIYEFAARVSLARGIILADTKFEFGFDAEGGLVLGDEVLTPDSSRYWPADEWQIGRAQPSFDKQPLRDWLRNESGWDPDGDAPPPALPESVVRATRERYLDAYQLLTGTDLDL